MKSIWIALSFCATALFAAETDASQDSAGESRLTDLLKSIETRVDDAYRLALQKNTDSNLVFVARGVRANRTTKTIEIDAHTTGLQNGDISEFYLITLNSGHDYEAFLQTFATANDIRKAFDFLNIPTGRPVDYDSYTFWSRGERIEATVSFDGAPATPLMDYIRNKETGKPYQDSTFVYIGGTKSPTGDALDIDSSGPGSLISCYNEKLTLLDVPRTAVQEEVYEKNVLSTNAPKQPGVPALIVLKPESRPANAPLRVREVDFSLSKNGISLDGADPVSIVEAVKRLNAFHTGDKQDVFLKVRWDDDVSMRDIRSLSRLLEKLDSAGQGIRIDAPPKGFPYAKAFLPRDEWRDRTKRFSQPCELRLETDENGTQTVTLVQITEEWKDEQIKPDLSFAEHTVAKPEDLPRLLEKYAPKDLNVLLVFVPGTLPYGTLRPYLDVSNKTHSLVQIFVD